MKTILSTAALSFILAANHVSAQSVDSALMQTYAAFDSAKAYPQMLMASNQFKFIAKQNPDNWLCNFYAAWSIAVTSFIEPNKDKKDPMLDEADAFYKKIESRDTVNDEVAVLGALLAAARLSVAPGSRHGKYGKISDGYLDMAKKINPNNPRIYYLQGNSFYYTPKLFGGGPEKALPLYEKAASLFPNDSQDIHKPHWGMKKNQEMLDDCRKKTTK
jgi:tetratricopeptide (TPR) repeat protein